MLPSPSKVVGNYIDVYEAYYNVVDPRKQGTISGIEAARFLKRSGLSDVILSKIWDLSDPQGRGYLDKDAMIVALKLIALVQNGYELKIDNVYVDVPPPKVGDIPIPKPTKPPPPVTSISRKSSSSTLYIDWRVKDAERIKYEKLFESLNPIGGLLSGDKVKTVLMDSKLPFDTLGKIWDLADQDKDGKLDLYEFIIAMHLVYKALEKHEIPNTLPAELMPPPKRKTSTSSISLNSMMPQTPPSTIMGTSLPQAKRNSISYNDNSWIVSSNDRKRFDEMFQTSDLDRDGFVSGQEIKDVFLKSGLPQATLADIWSLCDITQVGKLNNEQFALAMWLIEDCTRGRNPPPQALTPDMVPPSFRTKKQSVANENNSVKYSNPELDMVSRDIDELVRDKLVLETDISQKDADIKIKSGEIKSLQSELDTLSATLKQLENQQGEAQKRLNDIKAQKHETEQALEEVNNMLTEEILKVEKLRLQVSEQTETLNAQEKELNIKKEQLEELKQEEHELETQKSDNERKLLSLTGNLQNTQLHISQTKALITQLQEQIRQMKDAIEICDSGIETGDSLSVSDAALKIKPDFREDQYKMLNEEMSMKSNGFGDMENNNENGFSENLFKNDPFKNTETFGSTASDPFTSGFSNSADAFESDPFGEKFPQAKSFANENAFNAFNDTQSTNEYVQEGADSDKDAFGCDPFAILHAPTRASALHATSPPQRPTSPSPALPPKKSKQPPPRPAPPRPVQPPHLRKSTTPDAFSSDPFQSSDGFADFSGFQNKFTNNMSTPSAPSPHLDQSPQQKTVNMEFTDDPFRNYRYEDPFNIKFDDEPDDINNNYNSIESIGTQNVSNAFSNNKSKTNNNNYDVDGKFDPFHLNKPNTTLQSTMSTSSNAFTNNKNVYNSLNGNSDKLSNKNMSSIMTSGGKAIVGNVQISENDQLRWAELESLRSEESRKKRQTQEEADLELAIALSKIDVKGT